MKTNSMACLLRSDLYKLKKLKSVWIGLGLFCLLTLLLFAVMWVSDSVLTKAMQDPDFQAVDDLATMQYALQLMKKQMLIGCTTSGGLVLFLAIISGIFIGNDFNGGIASLTIARGGNRVQYYFSKWISVVVMTIVYCLIALIFSGILTAIKGYGEPFTATSFGVLIRSFALQVLAHIATASIFVMFSFIVRSTGAAVGTNIGFYLLLDILFGVISTFAVEHGDFLAFMPLMQADVAASVEYSTAELCGIIIMPIVYTALSSLIGALSFVKRDIK